MGSESCIHPTCGCKAYKDPGHPKGILLLMRLCCKGCGHSGSEHRRLTAVDGMVREEVERAGNVRCSHLIPLNEIPTSPVFRPHDPIPIPYDSDLDQGNGVHCTCPGFQVTSLVKLWQSFRSYTLSTTLTLLPTITCSHCGHTLQDHQPHPGGNIATPTNIGTRSGGGRERDITEEGSGVCNPQLTLKASAKLALTPFRGCVQILPAGKKEENGGKLTCVSLHSPHEGEIHVLVSDVELVFGEGEKQLQEEEEEEILSQTKTNSTHLNSSSVKGVDSTATDTSNQFEEASVSEKGCKGRKRRRRASVPATRKSVRLQGRAGREREREREEREKMATEAKRWEEERQRWRERETERVRGEQRVVCGHVVEFVSSLKDRTSFTHHPLPQAICRSGVELMRVARGGGGLVLSIGTSSGQVFIVSIISDTLLWWPLEADTSGKRKVKSLSWLDRGPNQLSLCAGYSGGTVVIWRVDLNTSHSQLEHSIVGRLQDTGADVTLTSWAPDKRVLAVGTLMGEVVFYVSGSEGSHYQCSQTVRCGGSAITCAAWLSNSSIMAVGGTDDSIHILQRKQSHVTTINSKPPNTSLFSYFKPVDADKFVYTHWLRGHCSFVSALLALGSRTLLSVGWDCHLLFWQDIEPIRLTDREVLPIEDSQPQTGFKLGPSTIAEYLPLSVCGVSGFGVLVLFTNTTGHVDISYYTFLPTETS